MKVFKSFLLAIVVWNVLASPVQAKDFCDSSVVRSWQNQREETAVSLLRLFLKGAKSDSLRAAGFELLRLEVLLSSCIPPLRIEDFYLHELPNPNPDLLPAAILKIYLRKQDLSLEPRDLFHGKIFWLESK